MGASLRSRSGPRSRKLSLSSASLHKVLSLRALIVPSLSFGWRSSLRCGGKRRGAPALIFCSLLGGRWEAESRLPKGSRAARALVLNRLSIVWLVLPKPLRPAFITLRLTGLLPLPPAPLRGERVASECQALCG